MWVLPVAVTGAMIALVLWQSERDHLAHLPDGYVRTDVGAFELYHPAGMETQATQIAESAQDFIDRVVPAFTPLLGELQPPWQSVRVTLFTTHNEFSTFASQTLAEDLSHSGGYFETGSLQIVLVLSQLSKDNGMGIRHEVAHLLLARGGGRVGTNMPTWLNEGLATWLETADPTDLERPSHVPDWVKLIAMSTEPPPVWSIVTADPQAFSQADNAVHYAYSALLVRFLVGYDPDRFWSWARDAREGRATDLAGFVGAVGPLGDLDAAWTGAMQAWRPMWARELAEEGERAARIRLPE